MPERLHIRRPNIRHPNVCNTRCPSFCSQISEYKLIVLTRSTSEGLADSCVSSARFGADFFVRRWVAFCHMLRSESWPRLPLLLLRSSRQRQLSPRLQHRLQLFLPQTRPGSRTMTSGSRFTRNTAIGVSLSTSPRLSTCFWSPGKSWSSMLKG